MSPMKLPLMTLSRSSSSSLIWLLLFIILIEDEEEANVIEDVARPLRSRRRGVIPVTISDIWEVENDFGELFDFNCNFDWDWDWDWDWD